MRGKAPPQLSSKLTDGWPQSSPEGPENGRAPFHTTSTPWNTRPKVWLQMPALPNGRSCRNHCKKRCITLWVSKQTSSTVPSKPASRNTSIVGARHPSSAVSCRYIFSISFVPRPENPSDVWQKIQLPLKNLCRRSIKFASSRWLLPGNPSKKQNAR